MSSKEEYQRLDKEIQFLRGELKRIRENPPDIPFLACDNSCCVAYPTGMSTNGGCRCDNHKLRAGIAYWKQLSIHYRSLFEIMRDGDRIQQWTDMREYFEKRK